jgi:hypothetical protein
MAVTPRNSVVVEIQRLMTACHSGQIPLSRWHDYTTQSPERPLQRRRVHSSRLALCPDFPLGVDLSQSCAGCQTSGWGEPTRGLQGSHPGKQRSTASVLRRFPPLVGDPLEVPGRLGGVGEGDATGYGEEMASYSISMVLALEIPQAARSSVGWPRQIR